MRYPSYSVSDFEFLEEDTIETTPEDHPHILQSDLFGTDAECARTIDELRQLCRASVIGTRISFETSISGKHQFGQFHFTGDRTVTLTRTRYADRKGGISSSYTDDIQPDKDEPDRSIVLGFARAVIRYVTAHPESMR